MDYSLSRTYQKGHDGKAYLYSLNVRQIWLKQEKYQTSLLELIHKELIKKSLIILAHIKMEHQSVMCWDIVGKITHTEQEKHPY